MAKAFLNSKGLEMQHLVGQGMFSKVFLCKNIVANKSVVDKITEQSNLENANAAASEYKILQNLNHEHIVSLLDRYMDRNTTHLILEFCELGTMVGYIRKKIKHDENMVRYCLQQMVLGMQYLQSLNISHLDLKPANILVTSKNDGYHNKLTLKLCDFAFAEVHVGDPNISEAKRAKIRCRGVVFYTAPERIQNKAFDAKADLWSLGMIAYESFYGKPYFQNWQTADVYATLINEVAIELPPTPVISEPFRKLLQSLLTYDKEERLNFAQLYRDEFIDMYKINSPENYLRSVRWIDLARGCCRTGNGNQAIDLYYGAADLLYPFEYGETVVEQQSGIFLKRCIYMNEGRRINEVLKLNRQIPVLATDEVITKRQIELLKQLCKTTEVLQNAIEISNVGEKYMAGLRNVLARKKFMEAAAIFVEQIKNEPSGPRLVMMYKQLSIWTALAVKLTDMRDNITFPHTAPNNGQL